MENRRTIFINPEIQKKIDKFYEHSERRRQKLEKVKKAKKKNLANPRRAKRKIYQRRQNRKEVRSETK